jgi:hypothetical protein
LKRCGTGSAPGIGTLACPTENAWLIDVRPEMKRARGALHAFMQHRTGTVQLAGRFMRRVALE